MKNGNMIKRIWCCLISRTKKLSDKYKNENSKLQDQKNNWTLIATHEINIRETIQNKLLKRHKKALEEIKSLKEIIKIPRNHFKYLEKMDYEQINNSKKIIQKKLVTSLKASRSIHKRYRSNGTRNTESIHFLPSVPSNTSFQFPSLNHSSRPYVHPDSFHQICSQERFPLSTSFDAPGPTLAASTIPSKSIRSLWE